MDTNTTQPPIEICGDLQDSPTAFGSVEILGFTAHEELIEKRNSCGFLESRDKEIHLSVRTAPAPIEKPIDIPSLVARLSSLLPGDRQLERRVRKLAWQLAKGRSVTCGWDLVFFSELTPTESRMADDEFVALYSDHVKSSTKKGGRPKKYRTAKAQKKGHSDCQRRYRERTLLVSSDVTKTPSQLADR